MGGGVSWAFLTPPKEVIQKIKEIDDLVPQEWRCDNKGNLSSSPIYQKYHITFLLKLSTSSKLDEIEKFLNSTPKFKVVIQDLYFSHVSRILTKNVYCMGWSVSSDVLQDLEAKCAKIMSCTPGGIHSNIVYVTEEYKDKLEALVKDHQKDLNGIEFIIDSVNVMGKEIRLKD